MSDKYEIEQRGHDSSGRPLKATKFAWQLFDRVNAKVGGKLVVVQGAFQTSGASASAGTHDKAGCFDIRTWNLTTAERHTMLKEARRLGAAAWYRTSAQGFDPHSHWVVIGDAPLASLAASQVDMYKKGYNGLGWYSHRDDFSYRPAVIHKYRYKEDDMANADQVMKELKALRKDFNTFREHEVKRDKESYWRDKRRYAALAEELGKAADLLGKLSNDQENDANKGQLRSVKKQILEALKNEQDAADTEKPSDEEQ